jgi:hypothetical protein
VPPSSLSPYKPRDILEIDLSPVLHVRENTNVVRRAVVVIVEPQKNYMLIVFGAYDAYHHPTHCVCIRPGTEEAKPFGSWLIKETHFSASNVVQAPLDVTAKIVGRIEPDYPDLFDEFGPPVEFALQQSTAKNIPPRKV